MEPEGQKRKGKGSSLKGRNEGQERRADQPEVIHEDSHQAQLVSKAQQDCQAVRVHRHAVAVLCEVLHQLC